MFFFNLGTVSTYSCECLPKIKMVRMVHTNLSYNRDLKNVIQKASYRGNLIFQAGAKMVQVEKCQIRFEVQNGLRRVLSKSKGYFKIFWRFPQSFRFDFQLK